MPQKKNPDVPELVRGKSARVFGHLIALLTLMKSQPLAYNKDNQEDKEPLFDTVTTLEQCLHAYSQLILQLDIDRDRARAAASIGYTTATDLADYLVRKGITFRDAHAIVGRAVRDAIERGKELVELSLEQLQTYSDAIESDVFEVLSLDGAVAARDHLGGTAPAQVQRAVARVRERLGRGPTATVE